MERTFELRSAPRRVRYIGRITPPCQGHHYTGKWPKWLRFNTANTPATVTVAIMTAAVRTIEIWRMVLSSHFKHCSPDFFSWQHHAPTATSRHGICQSGQEILHTEAARSGELRPLLALYTAGARAALKREEVEPCLIPK